MCGGGNFTQSNINDGMFVRLTADEYNNGDNVDVDYVRTRVYYSIMDYKPPGSITGLINQSKGSDWIYWTWTNPTDEDFDKALVYINGASRLNTSNEYYNATGLQPGTVYTLTIHTRDTAGVINDSDINSTWATFKVPEIEYSTGTEPDNSMVTRDWIYINISADDDNEANITFFLFNQSYDNINKTVFGSGNRSINFTSLNNGIYYYNVTIVDHDLFLNSTETRKITLDTEPPLIQIIGPFNRSGDADGEISFEYNVTDLGTVTNCSHILEGTVNETTESVIKNSVMSFLVGGLNTIRYNWSIKCSDEQGLVGNSGEHAVDVIMMMSYSGDSTDLSTVDTSNIINFTIDRPLYGRIRYTQAVDLSGGADLDSIVGISQNTIDIDTITEPRLNKSARLELNNLAFVNQPLIQRNSQICPQSICSFVSYSNSSLDFNVSSFTSYSATENSQLSIWDSTDPEGGSLTLFVYDNVTFNANYTNRTSGIPINGTGDYCEIMFDLDGWTDPVNMTYDSAAQLYYHNRSFNISGLLDWTINCTSSNGYESLGTVDKVAVRPLDFFIQRGSTTIATGGSTATISAGPDYSAPESNEKAFIRIVSTRLSGVGHDNLGNTQDPDEYMVSITDPENMDTSITFERYSSTATFNTRIYWEIIEYTGPDGGPNEIIVRDQAELQQSSGPGINGSQTTVADDDDIVVFITGQRHNGVADSSTTDRGLYTSEWLSSTDKPSFTRGDGTGSSSLSYAVVEFTGSHWKIQRQEHVYTASGAWQTENINAVGAVNKTFIHAQMRTGSGNLDEQGQEVFLSANDTLSFRLYTGAGIFSQTAVVWIIENTLQLGVYPFGQRFGNTRASGGAEPDQWTEAISSTGRTFTTSIWGETASSSGGGSAVPRGAIGLELTDNDEVTLWRSDTGQTQRYQFEVFEWPTGEHNFPPTEPTSLRCNGNLDCDIVVSQSVDIEASGSEDFEGDNISYYIEASLENTTISGDQETGQIQLLAQPDKIQHMYYDDFSTNTGIWSYSGTCTRRTGDTECQDGSACLRCLGGSGSGEDGAATDTIGLDSYDECEIRFGYRANSLESGECAYHRYTDTSEHDTLQICDPNDDNTWHNTSYNYSSLGYTLEPDSEIKFSIEASGTGDYWYVDRVNLTCFSDPYVEDSTNTTVYQDAFSGTFRDIDNITITIDVSAYDNSGSTQAGDNNPDLELSLYNGTGWKTVGSLGVNQTSNFSVVITDNEILTAWKSEENRDIRLQGIYFNYNNSVNVDEINWTNVWTEVIGRRWTSIGNHTNATSLTWNTSQVAEQECIDLRARAMDHNNASSGYYTKGSCIDIDYTPPEISNVDNQSITDTSALIVWDTNEQANSSVYYWNQSMNNTAQSSAFVVSHSVPLTSLSPLTLYYYNVTSCDVAGNCNSSGGYNFTTAAAPDMTPPGIYNVNVSEITETTARINWTTDENANSTVEYGTDIGLGTIKTSSFYVTDHSIVVDALKPVTTYYFNVSSCDLSDNCNESGPHNFTTPDLTDPTVTDLWHPPDGSFVNLLAIDFNFTVVDNIGIDNCTLYGTFNGTFSPNTSIYSPVNNTEANITIPVKTGSYTWNILCYDTSGNYDWYDTNYTFNQEDRVMFISETVVPDGTHPNTSVNVYGHINLSDSTDVVNNPIHILANDTSIELLLLNEGDYNASAWWNISWYYRKPINLTENNNTDLDSYAVNIFVDTEQMIGDGKMNSNCSDMRFTNSSHALLDFWIESGCNTSSTSVWIDINISANSSQDLYMYYGNPGAAMVSNASATFFFYDDFNDGDINGWQDYGTGDLFYANDSGNGVIWKDTNDDPNGGYAVFSSNISEFETRFRSNRINSNGGAQNRYAVSDSSFNGYGPRVSAWDASATFAVEERSGGASTGDVTSTSVTMDSNTWYLWIYRRHGANVEAEIYNSTGSQLYSISGTDTTVSQFDRFVIHGGNEYYTDNIIVRPYVPNEPTYELLAEQAVLMTDNNGDYNYTFNASLPDGAYHIRVNSTYNVVIRKEVYELLYIDSVNPDVSIGSIVPNPAERVHDDVVVNWTATDVFLSTNYASVYYPNNTLLDLFFDDFIITAANLTVAGEYNISVYAIDLGYNENSTWTNLTVQDTIIPNITNIRNESVTNVSALIKWDTTEPANSTVRWGNTTALQNISLSTDFVMSHSIPLTGLKPLTTYYYNITSCDPYDNCRTNGTFNFTTSGVGDSTPPGIYNVNVSEITEVSARINWTTDENANASLEYGINISLLNHSYDPVYDLEHSIFITGLSPNTVYFFNVSSCDLSGNCNESGIHNFTTLDTTPPNVTALTNPDNADAFPFDYVDFNFTANDNDKIENCSLWADFNGSFARNITIHNITHDQETNISLDVPDGDFIWNIECVDQVGNSGFYYQNFTLTIDTVDPNPFNLTTPANTTNASDYTPLLIWTQTSDAHFKNYTIEVDDDPGFGSVNYVYGTFAVGTTQYQVEEDWQINKTYYWRVTAYDLVNNSYTTAYFSYFTAPVHVYVSLNLSPQYVSGATDINASGKVNLTSGEDLPSNPVYIYIDGVLQVAPGDGSDGFLNVTSAGTVVNSYAYATDSAVQDATSLNVSSTIGFSEGDEILVIQVQDSTKAGNYQFVKDISVGSGHINFTTPLRNSYSSGVFDQEGATVTMIVRIPQYTNVTIQDGAGIVAPAWDGYTGGIVAFKVQDTIRFLGDAHINVSEIGYRGGGCGLCDDSDWGQNGEGVTGIGSGGGVGNPPDNFPDPDTGSNGGVGGYGPTGESGEPGGGGSYGTLGTNGTASSGNDAGAGEVVGDANLTKIMFGGGGGGGGDDDSQSPQAIGGSGGGAVIVYANRIINATVYSTGEDGVTDGGYGGESGAGAGGAIWLSAYNMTMNDVNASGGIGFVDGADKGGDGGDGRIRLDYEFYTGLTDPLPGHNETPMSFLTDENAQYSHIFTSSAVEGKHTVIVNSTYLYLEGTDSLDYYVDLTPPNVTILSPLGNSYNATDVVNITANISDFTVIDYVYCNISWDSSVATQQMTDLDGDGVYYTEFYSTQTLGRYNITIFANDTLGHINNTEKSFFLVNDTEPPDVREIEPFFGEIFLANDTVQILTNVTDNLAVHTVLANITWPGGYEVLGMINISPDLYVLNFTNTSLGGRYNVTIIANDTGGNINSTETTWFLTEHRSYNIYYGNATGDIGLGLLADLLSNMTQEQVVNIYSADIDSSFEFQDLQAVGLGKDNSTSSDDFSEIDTLLGMSGHTDSIEALWGINSTVPKETSTFVVYGRTIEDVPVVNSTDNNTIFKTGILWDMDDSADNEFDSSEGEDLVFVVAYNDSQIGTYGTYGYEVRVPDYLDIYKDSTELIEFYVEAE